MNTYKKNKHLTLQDRIAIQEGLYKGMSFKSIAEMIGKSPSTISREVKAHLKPHRNGFVKTDSTCPLLLKAPFVCNGCPKKSSSSCCHLRQLYTAKTAQFEYKETLVEARTGIALNKESFYETERIISAAIMKGQHVYHAIKANNLSVSPATVYRHIKLGYYSAKPIDLPRAVKFKPRTSQRNEYVPHSVRKNRTYQDYLEYIANNDDLPIIELDTVIGRVGGKVILTIHFVNSDFMIGLLLDNKTAAEAASKIEVLKHHLSSQGVKFGDIAPVLLTDNGGEFSNANAFENDADGEKESHLFYCEPNTPSEKPHIEKNHTLFRDIVPKGSSFDDFTQDTVNLIFSHVNAVKRKQFNGKSAYEMFAFFYSRELADILGIKFIPAEDVIQSPRLIKSLSK